MKTPAMRVSLVSFVLYLTPMKKSTTSMALLVAMANAMTGFQAWRSMNDAHTVRAVPTSNENIMRVECPALSELAVLRQAVDALLNAARSHDANAMRAALHTIDPSINIP